MTADSFRFGDRRSSFQDGLLEIFVPASDLSPEVKKIFPQALVPPKAVPRPNFPC